jgi:hypothetical protein
MGDFFEHKRCLHGSMTFKEVCRALRPLCACVLEHALFTVQSALAFKELYLMENSVKGMRMQPMVSAV